MQYTDRLHAAVRTKGNPCLVGLDPHPASIPAEFQAVHDPAATRAEQAAAVGDFLCEVIEVVAERAPAVKPQSAFFELYGADGALAWERVVRAARAAGLIVIGDIKRGDIGSTAAAYAAAFLGGQPGADDETRCDAVTINPYLGTDSVQPFLDKCREQGAGVYVLVRTSNPSSAEFQASGDPPLSERVAEAVERWGAELIGSGGWSDVGAVVGATHPSELAELRRRLPRTPFLLPGFGAQGAGAADVASGFTAEGLGAVVNSSRGILYAYKNRPEIPWRAATRAALEEMADELGRAVSART
jgi:orotidine-5'-phosphate decarboxylase